MGDHGGVVTRGSGHLAAVPGLLLQVADNGTLWHVSHGHYIPDGELGFAATVNKLAGVHALSSDQQLLLGLVAVGVSEVGDGQGSSTAGIVDDVLHHSLNTGKKWLEIASLRALFPTAKIFNYCI